MWGTSPKSSKKIPQAAFGRRHSVPPLHVPDATIRKDPAVGLRAIRVRRLFGDAAPMQTAPDRQLVFGDQPTRAGHNNLRAHQG